MRTDIKLLSILTSATHAVRQHADVVLLRVGAMDAIAATHAIPVIHAIPVAHVIPATQAIPATHAIHVADNSQKFRFLT